MKLMHPGLLEMPATDYHAHKALGHSSLLKLLRSPAHYQEYINTTHEASAAQAFGTAVHAAILEPAVFEGEYVVFDEAQLVGTLQSVDDYKAAADALGIKVGKMKKDDLKVAIKATDTESKFKFRDDAIAELYAGKIVLDIDQMASIQAIKRNISNHAGASLRLARGHAELSGFWIDQETGVECKIRPDFLVLDSEGSIVAILDVKTTRDASMSGFVKSVVNFGYDVQAAYYTDGLKQIIGREVPFLFLAIENDGPHSVALYRADSEMLEAGRKKYRAGLLTKKWCEDNQVWPGYQSGDEEELISLPRWAVAGAAAYDIE